MLPPLPVPKIYLHEYALISVFAAFRPGGRGPLLDFIFQLGERALAMMFGNWSWSNNRGGRLRLMVKSASFLLAITSIFYLWQDHAVAFNEFFNPIMQYLEFFDWPAVMAAIMGLSGLVAVMFVYLDFKIKAALTLQKFSVQGKICGSKSWAQKQYWLNQFSQEILRQGYWPEPWLMQEFSWALYFSIHALYSLCPTPFLFSEASAQAEWQRFLSGRAARFEAQAYLQEYGALLARAQMRPKKATAVAEAKKVA